VRDVVVSGGDVANLPWPRLESFVSALLEIDSIRDIRLASKALMGLPQYWLSDEVRAGMARLAGTARARGVSIAIHTHVNAAQSVTPLVAQAAAAMLEAGVRDVRNQGVLLRGTNDSAAALLDLCFALLDGSGIMPYYFYMCDMIPGSEHWRLTLAEGQALQEEIMGYLPGFATPRMVCDVPYVGKRWVHQVAEYDTERGISYWTKNYRTSIEAEDADALSRHYEYYDPIHTLPEAGQAWWREHGPSVDHDAAHLAAEASRTAAAAGTGHAGSGAGGASIHIVHRQISGRSRPYEPALVRAPGHCAARDPGRRRASRAATERAWCAPRRRWAAAQWAHGAPRAPPRGAAAARRQAGASAARPRLRLRLLRTARYTMPTTMSTATV
jgi:lysine 2,3-aminomutase